MRAREEQPTAPPSRARIAAALGVSLGVPTVLFVFAGILAIVTGAHAGDRSMVAPFWGTFAVLSASSGAILLRERKRTFDIADVLLQNRSALESAGASIDGVRVLHDTPLVRYPLHAVLAVLRFETWTAPSPGARPGMLVLALYANLVLGWWSFDGLVATPRNLLVCARGGAKITAAQVLAQIDAQPEPSIRRGLARAAVLMMAALGVMTALVVVIIVVAEIILALQ